MQYIKNFSELRNTDVALVGGKNASLGEMVSMLKGHGVSVPDGFAPTSQAYRYLLSAAALRDSFAAKKLQTKRPSRKS